MKKRYAVMINGQYKMRMNSSHETLNEAMETAKIISTWKSVTKVYINDRETKKKIVIK